MKTCTKCGEERPLGEYGVDGRATDGRKSACKACMRGADRIYRQSPKAKALAAKRMREWRGRNPKLVRERNRERWFANRAENLERLRRYREANPKVMRRTERRWRERNKTRKAELERQRLARKRDAYVEDIDIELLYADGNVCGICWLPIEEPPQVDHIIPVAAGGEHSQANAQLAHPLCNQRKGAKTDYEAA